MQYGTDQLKEAVNQVSNGVLSVRQASSQFGIPKSTIQDEVSGVSPIDKKPGRPTAIPLEIESKIVAAVKEASKRGLGISRKQLLVRTGVLCQRMGIAAFKNKTPSKDWWNGVRKRHPELTLRKPEKLGASRARMTNPVVVNNYFACLGNVLDALCLKEKPAQVWNCDETSKTFQHNPTRVIADKAARNTVGKVADNRDNITIMTCVNANGGKMPPMFVAKGKTSVCLRSFRTEDGPIGSEWTYQTNGWMNDELGELWFEEVFL